jgi:hypothetical protein
MEREPNRMPTAREMADAEKYAKAKARGEMHGFTDIFLDHFIELELTMMQKWDNRRKGLGIMIQS